MRFQLVLICHLGVVAASFGPCPPKGAVFPPPTTPSKSTAVQSALAALQSSMDAAVAGGKLPYGNNETGGSVGFNANSTSFAASIWSANEDAPLWTYFNSAPELAHPTIGVSHVDANSIWRLGSISKLLSVYIYLASVGDKSFSDPVSRYIPEFAAYMDKHAAGRDSTLDLWDFDAMTVGSLASQLSGLPRETRGGFFEEDTLDQLGLPKVPPTPPNISGADCNNTYHIPCSRKTFMENILGEHPVSPTFQRPAYSNVAYGVLGLVLENITGMALPDLFDTYMVKDLGLNATYYAVPPTPDQGVIPYNDSAALWSTNIQNLSAAGNYYSSLNDMQKIGSSILNYKLLSPTLTRSWLRPSTFADDIHAAVGAPWEIYQAHISGRPSWIFAKQGDTGLYSTTVALFPDHNIGLTVLSAGNDCTFTNRFAADLMAEHISPAIEQAAHDESAANSAGSYCDHATNSSIVLAVDDKPGLSVSSWTANGTDMLGAFSSLLDMEGVYLRLYPSGLRSADGTKVGYNALAYSAAEVRDPGTFSINCFEWASIDAPAYGGYGIDQLSFAVDPKTVTNKENLGRVHDMVKNQTPGPLIEKEFILSSDNLLVGANTREEFIEHFDELCQRLGGPGHVLTAWNTGKSATE